jgi:hypothetical protein
MPAAKIKNPAGFLPITCRRLLCMLQPCCRTCFRTCFPRRYFVYTVRPLPFLFGLHPAFLRRRGQDSSPAPAREVPLLTQGSHEPRRSPARVQGEQIKRPETWSFHSARETDLQTSEKNGQPSLNARWNCPNPRSAYLLRSAESRCSACSNLLAASGVLKSPVRISRLVAS